MWIRNGFISDAASVMMQLLIRADDVKPVRPRRRRIETEEKTTESRFLCGSGQSRRRSHPTPAVRQFVAAGGICFGVCAGCHWSLCKPRRIGLLPCTYIDNGFGNWDPLIIELSEQGDKAHGQSHLARLENPTGG